MLLYVALLGIGIAGMVFGSLVAVPFAVIGAGGLGRPLWRWWRAHVDRRAVEAARARHAALKAARREREAQQRAQRQAQRAVKARAKAGSARALAAQRQAESARAAQQSAQQALREHQVSAQVDRLRALPDAQLPSEVATILERRGLRRLSPEIDVDCDLRLVPENENALEVARCVPRRRMAGTIDVQELEAWRHQSGARHAYLIALGGFSPQAVRHAYPLPITLVEAYLLAQWHAFPSQVAHSLSETRPLSTSADRTQEVSQEEVSSDEVS